MPQITPVDRTVRSLSTVTALCRKTIFPSLNSRIPSQPTHVKVECLQGNWGCLDIQKVSYETYSSDGHGT